jgi:hypothetical protein
MGAFTVEPPVVTATDVPLKVVVWKAGEATTILAGPSPLPFITNSEP